MPDTLGTLVAPKSSGKPEGPATGQLHYDTATDILYWYNGSEWVSSKGGEAGAAGEGIYRCRAATTGNITTSTGLNNGDSLDGVTLATGDRVLVKNQTTASQNGIYVVGASPARATDADGASEFQSGSLITISEGTVNADTVWMLTTNGAITHGTTGLAFTRRGGAFAEKKLASADLKLASTVTVTDVPGLSVTVPDAGRYSVVGYFDSLINVAGPAGMVGTINVAGAVPEGSAVYVPSGVGERTSYVHEWIVTAAAGDVIKARVANLVAAGETITAKTNSVFTVKQII